MQTKLFFISLTIFTMAYGQAPIAPEQPHTLQKHGHTRNDEFFWMNQRDSKEVLDHLQKENTYSEAFFSKHKALTNRILDEFEQRIDPNDVSAPFRLNGKTYQVKNIEGKDYQQIVVLDGTKETVFLDENLRATNHSFYELAEWAPSPDNNLLAIAEDIVGRRKYTITIRQNNSGKFLKDKIVDTDGSVVWANDNKTLFYVKKDPQTLREFQIYRHVIGTDSKKDVLVYQEDDERFAVQLGKTLTDAYIVIGIGSSTTSEYRLIDANQAQQQPTIFLARKQGHMYEIAHHETGFYILSNDQATNRKIVFSPSIPTDISACKEIIGHTKETLIENLLVLKDFLVTEVRTNGLLKIDILQLSNGNKRSIDFPEETYFTALGLNDDYYANNLFYDYNSLTTPASVYTYNLSTGKSDLWFRHALRDPNFKPENYVSERIWATANDGTKIPVCIVYKKGTNLKNAPCLLYGYGSYGITLPDVFRATRLSLLDRGFVYAVAHIRGSKYMGEEWYETGKFLQKTNTFTDFINAAEYLGMKGYCDPSKIYAQGGSAGGLLMGAVMNKAPYMWKGVIAQVPFVDVVTTMLDETIPLTVGEYEEWGNPNDETYYYYMLNYSPYDNVRKMDYPNVLVTTGYHDSQVQYWEPMKWVARLRKLKTDTNLLLFDCNMDAGHGGGSGRSVERLEKAKEFTFLLVLEGIEK